MAKFEIELGSVEVTSRKVTLVVDCAKLTPEVVLALAEHGLTQKIGDAASQAAKLAAQSKFGDKVDMRDAATQAWLRSEAAEDEIRAITLSLMEKARDGLYAGEWTRRGEGTSVDPRVNVARRIVRNAVKEKFGAKSPEWAKFTGLADAAQTAKLDEWYGANAAAFDPAIDAEMERLEAARKAKAKLASSLDFAL